MRKDEKEDDCYEQQNTKILRYYKRDTLLTLYSFIQKSEEQNTDLSFATF